MLVETSSTPVYLSAVMTDAGTSANAQTPSPTAHQPEPVGFSVRGWTLVLAFIAIYLCSFALLAWRINERPGFPYNWETYTIRGLLDYIQRPDGSIFGLNEGLMTDSGRSVAVVWPSWLGFTLFGQTWMGLRLPIVAIAALAPALTWILGRKLSSDIVGLTAAALMATSQVFLLYGRTATNVGMSLTPALFAFICLWMCVRPGQMRTGLWLGLLQVSLIVNSFFYSPLRFLWLIALALFALEWVLRRGDRVRFVIGFALTLVVLPVAIMLLRPGPTLGPEASLRSYYYGRGEQIFRINDDRANYLPYFRPDTPEERKEIEEATEHELAIRLVKKNAADLIDLLVDHGTKPAITDYWNPNGRLLPQVLVPFLLIGLGLTFWRVFKEPRARFVLALFFGFSVPLVLTSQVHIGRLIYVVPVVALLCALPIEYAARLVSRHVSRETQRHVQTWGVALVGVLLVVLAGIPTMGDWSTEFPIPRMVFVAERIQELKADYPNHDLVYVFGDLGGYEVESLRVAELEMLLDGELRFLDTLTGFSRGEGDTLFRYGAVMPMMSHPDSLPGYCTNLYLVEPNRVEEFIAITEPVAQERCGHSLVFNELP